MSRRARSRPDKRAVTATLLRSGPEDEDGEGDTPDTEPAEIVTVTGQRIDLREAWGVLGDGWRNDRAERGPTA